MFISKGSWEITKKRDTDQVVNKYVTLFSVQTLLLICKLPSATINTIGSHWFMSVLAFFVSS